LNARARAIAARTIAVFSDPLQIFIPYYRHLPLPGRRRFDRAVVKTLSQWKFSAGGNGREKEIEIAFKR